MASQRHIHRRQWMYDDDVGLSWSGFDHTPAPAYNPGEWSLWKWKALIGAEAGVSSMKGQRRLERCQHPARGAVAKCAGDAWLLAVVDTHEPAVRAAMNALFEHFGGLID